MTWRKLRTSPLKPGSTLTRVIFDDFDTLVDDFETVSDKLDATHMGAVNRVMANNNTFTNNTTYSVMPNATDKAACTLTLTKHRADTHMIVHFASTGGCSSGVAQTFYAGLRINGLVDITVAQFRALSDAPVRFPLCGVYDIAPLAAGTYVFEPVWKASTAAHSSGWFSTDDYISYSVTETL